MPETPLRAGEILVYQAPNPELLRFLEPRETETHTMHALSEYGVMHVKLYEDVSRHGHIATTYAYPARVAGRYIMDPSPIPKFDNPKLDDCPALQLFGAGREKRIYAISPYTRVIPLDFEDHTFERTKFDAACPLCSATNSYLDEVVTDDAGGRMFVCSDTDYCEKRQSDERKDAAERAQPCLSPRVSASVELIAERRASGTGFLAIFHDEDVRARLADRMIDVSAFSMSEAA